MSKYERCASCLIFALDVDRLACCVFIPRREEKLVNISVSVNARMPILEMNTDETTYERGANDI